MDKPTRPKPTRLSLYLRLTSSSVELHQYDSFYVQRDGGGCELCHPWSINVEFWLLSSYVWVLITEFLWLSFWVLCHFTRQLDNLPVLLFSFVNFNSSLAVGVIGTHGLGDELVLPRHIILLAHQCRWPWSEHELELPEDFLEFSRRRSDRVLGSFLMNTNRFHQNASALFQCKNPKIWVLSVIHVIVRSVLWYVSYTSRTNSFLNKITLSLDL